MTRCILSYICLVTATDRVYSLDIFFEKQHKKNFYKKQPIHLTVILEYTSFPRFAHCYSLVIVRRAPYCVITGQSVSLNFDLRRELVCPADMSNPAPHLGSPSPRQPAGYGASRYPGATNPPGAFLPPEVIPKRFRIRCSRPNQ